MKRFQSNIDKEIRQAYPDRRKLEYQCLIPISFVGRGQSMLDSPCWVMIINVVALDMLKRKLPTGLCQNIISLGGALRLALCVQAEHNCTSQQNIIFPNSLEQLVPTV